MDNRTRHEVAALAARLMTESGLPWHEARAKAARRLGADLSSRQLPDERDITAALVSYQALFEPDHASIVAHLRAAAHQAMLTLQDFNPVLVGSVAEGTATPHAEIELILTADSEKDVELRLINAHIGYRAINVNAGGSVTLLCDNTDPVVRLTIYTRSAPHRAPAASAPKTTLNLSELEQLLGVA